MRAGELLRGASALADGLGEVRGELKGPVSLGCYTGLASNVLLPVLEGMANLHPKVEISISVGDHSDLLPAIEDAIPRRPIIRIRVSQRVAGRKGLGS